MKNRVCKYMLLVCALSHIAISATESRKIVMANLYSGGPF
jgi:hypothetical protein